MQPNAGWSTRMSTLREEFSRRPLLIVLVLMLVPIALLLVSTDFSVWRDAVKTGSRIVGHGPHRL